MSITTELGFETPVNVSKLNINGPTPQELAVINRRKLAKLRLARIKLSQSKWSGNWANGCRK